MPHEFQPFEYEYQPDEYKQYEYQPDQYEQYEYQPDEYQRLLAVGFCCVQCIQSLWL